MDDVRPTIEDRPTGDIEDVSVLDLTSMRSEDDLVGIGRIHNVAVVLVPESLTGALARIPTSDVASVVPVPDGADARVHTGTVVLGGDALADPAAHDAVLVVTGTLALSSPVTEVTYRRIIVTGMVLAPRGSEAVLAAGLTRVTGSVQYYDYEQGQHFRTRTGQIQLSGDALANTHGDPADILFLAGQTVVTGPVTEVGYQQILAAGQVVAPQDSEALLAPKLTIEGQLVWYRGQPRLFSGEDRFGRAFFELLDEPLALLLVGSFAIDDDVPAALLREKVSDITLVGKLTAPEDVVPVLQLLTTQKHGTITTEQAAGEHG